MRSPSGLTILQLLLTIAVIWGAVVLLGPHVPRVIEHFFGQGSEVQRYFSQVLVGIERARDVEGKVPYAQSCSSLTLRTDDSADVLSCTYLPSVDRNYFTLTVIGKSNEVLRYAGNGGK